MKALFRHPPAQMETRLAELQRARDAAKLRREEASRRSQVLRCHLRLGGNCTVCVHRSHGENCLAQRWLARGALPEVAENNSASPPLTPSQPTVMRSAGAGVAQEIQRRKSLRIVTLGISGGRSLSRPFRDARRCPCTGL